MTLGIGLASVLVAAPIAYASDYGLGATAGAAGLNQQGDVATIIGNIIGTGLSLISVLFFIMMIYGGIMWMTARGKDDVSKKALDTIFAAIIGIIIVLSAYAITTFVFKSVSGDAPTGNGGGTTPPATTVTECAAICESAPGGKTCATVTGTEDENLDKAVEYECTDVKSGACPEVCPTE